MAWTGSAAVVFDWDAPAAVLFCLTLAGSFVGSLYVKADQNIGRDHPQTIKDRFLRVSVVCGLAGPLVWLCSTSAQTQQSRDVMTWLGLRLQGLVLAAILPLLLTMILFLGPLSLLYFDGVLNQYADCNYWSNNVKNLIWLRNHVVGPLAEEFVFRACMLPVLVPAFGENYAVLLCPVFFGVAHLHHMYERVSEGVSLKDAALRSAIQFSFTTVFGIYSAFLFLRTGHLVAPLIAHSFCNHMGFPNFEDALSHPPPTRYYVVAAFVLGLAAWTLLLYPLTSPRLYGNSVYYAQQR